MNDDAFVSVVYSMSHSMDQWFKYILEGLSGEKGVNLSGGIKDLAFFIVQA